MQDQVEWQPPWSSMILKPSDGYQSLIKSQDFSKYLGFHQEWKKSLNLQANADAKQFMRELKTLYQISKLTGSKFKQAVYRATPHCTTNVALADLMYPVCKFCTRLPIGVTPREHSFKDCSRKILRRKCKWKGTQTTRGMSNPLPYMYR